MKKLLNVVILSEGNFNGSLLQMIGQSNANGNNLSIKDIEGYLKCHKVQYPTANKELQWGIYENTIEITEDNGDSFTLKISEVESAD